jgi:phycocyanobilin lyase subunit alpha
LAQNVSDCSDNPANESLTLDQAIANLQGDDLGLRAYAAWWLGRFRVDDSRVIALLIQALKDEADRTPEGGFPLRRNAARALGKLGDPVAVPALIEALDCSDFYVRDAAVQSLEMLNDLTCVPKLMILLEVGLHNQALVENQPDFAQPYDAVLEALGTLGATIAVPLIQPFLSHPIDRVQYAAHRAMYQLTLDPTHGELLTAALAGEDLQLRRAALADLGAIGYLPAAEAIAQTLAENSLKLIALKGILEKEVLLSPADQLSDGAVQVLELMDSLL